MKSTHLACAMACAGNEAMRRARFSTKGVSSSAGKARLITFCQLRREIIAAYEHLQGASPPDEPWQSLRSAATRNKSNRHLWMAEDPEEVLPEDRRAAGLRVEEVRAQEAIEQQHDLRRRQRQSMLQLMTIG